MVKDTIGPNEILEENSITAPKQEVIYYRPKFHRRVLANLIDVILFIFLFVSLFIGARAIMSNTAEYQANLNNLDQMRLDSGLYRKDKNGMTQDIITYINSDTAYNTEAKMDESKKAINKFLTYAQSVCSPEDYEVIATNYDEYRMSESMVYNKGDSAYNGTALFILNEYDEIVENPALIEAVPAVPNIYGYYYDNVYMSYVDKVCQGYLVTMVPSYYDTMQYLALTVIFAVIIPAYLLSGIIVYYVPTLIFVRGRCTFGKALYRIGLVDSRILTPTFWRATARFSIFYFAELILSLATFGLPYILSFSLMVFSKNKQGFPDYMLGLNEIDMSRTKIYKSFDEVDLDKVNAHRKAVDFKVPNFD